MDPARRRFLRLSGIAAVGAIAGCSTETTTDTPDPGDGGGNDDGADGGATPTATPTPTPTSGSGDGQFDFGGWLRDTSNYDGTTADMRGNGSITIDVGASANDGAFGFAPPAVWVDPGTEVTWEWTGDGGGHNVVAESSGDFRSGDPTSEAGTSFSQTFDTAGIVTYYCNPHRSMGMKGAVVVGDPDDSATATPASQEYSFQAASFDAYWYSLYNMSTNIAMSANGVPFPLNEQMEQLQSQRMPAMLENAEVDRPPITDPNLSLASFTEGDPSFTQEPVLEDDTGRPDASTLAWDKSNSSLVVSPSSVGWTHLKGVTWAKNFQNHFDLLPGEMAPKFRAQLLTTLAQVGVNAAILVGGSRGNGALTHGDSFEFLSEYHPSEGRIVDETRRPHHHSAMLWFLSDLNSLAQNGWFGYVNPRPLIPKEAGADGVFDPPVGIQEITDGVADATMNLFDASEVASMESTRSVGQMLAAVGYYAIALGTLLAFSTLVGVLTVVEVQALAAPLAYLAVAPVLDLLKTGLYDAHRGVLSPPSGAVPGLRRQLTSGGRRGVRAVVGFVRESPGLHALALALGLAGAAMGWAVSEPLVGVLDASIAERLADHVPPLAAANFFANNWTVAISTALSGVALAVPAGLSVWFNGVVLGVVARLEVTPIELAAFVLPHGIFEIPSILVAGALGLHLGVVTWRAWRGRMGREALADALERAFWVLVGLGVVLAIAGLIEGFISPYYWRVFI